MFHFPGCPPMRLFYSSHGDGALPPPGFPIRISMDLCPFAAPHGFSQLTTSFFGNQCHWHPPCALVRLISSLHPLTISVEHLSFKIQYHLSMKLLISSAFALLTFLTSFLCSFQGALYELPSLFVRIPPASEGRSLNTIQLARKYLYQSALSDSS